MTNEQAKQEAIKKAYGDLWDLVVDLTPKDGNYDHDLFYNGYFNLKHLNNSNLDMFPSSEFIYDYDNSTHGYVIPNSIVALHTNNGWIRIEPDGSNLPERGEYRWLYESGNMADFYYEPGDIMSIRLTHYKPITPELKPIY